MAVVRRLPRYYRYLDDLYHAGVLRISSKLLAERMDLTASQIRQDFNNFGGFGQQGYGYNVEHLRREIGSILGLNNNHTAILIGVGNIGHALLANFTFERHGFTLTAAFDTKPELIGTQIRGLTILDVAGLDDFCKDKTPDIAVLTVPRSVAPSMASRLALLGVRGLWNFANIDLDTQLHGEMARQKVTVENVHFSDSLMTLCYRIGAKKD